MPITRLLAALICTGLLSGAAAAADAVSGATAKHSVAPGVMPANLDAVTSASVVPAAERRLVKANGFDAPKITKRVLLVVGDPRHESVEWDMVNTAAKHFMDKGWGVEIRDLYAMGFDPVVRLSNFFNAKDGFGETPADVKVEQDYVRRADYIVFCYPNWHDSPNAITKGYMERVFAKGFAYRDGKAGLEGLLKGKAVFTIMNAGWIGQGRGDVGDGIPQKAGEKSNPIWDKYLNAYKVVDDDTAGFWGVTNLGRFVNDRTPGNLDKDYAQKIQSGNSLKLVNLS